MSGIIVLVYIMIAAMLIISVLVDTASRADIDEQKLSAKLGIIGFGVIFWVSLIGFTLTGIHAYATTSGWIPSLVFCMITSFISGCYFVYRLVITSDEYKKWKKQRATLQAEKAEAKATLILP